MILQWFRDRKAEHIQRKAWRQLERLKEARMNSFELQDYRRRREAALKHTRASA